MPERLFTILSTAALPFDRIPQIPETVDVKVVPFLEISPLVDTILETEVAILSAKKITAVFTSAHAVHIVAGLLKQKPNWKIYCIRNETRIAVVNWFGSGANIKFASNALFLSKYMIADEIREAVFFCGDQRMDILPDNLRQHGVRLTERVVYKTVLTPVYLNEHPDAILFFSPSAVRSFFSVNALLSQTTVFAMGTTTAAALIQFTTNPVIISPEADKAFVFNMAMEYAGKHPII